MYWILGVKFVDLGDSCTVGGDPVMNIIIARVPVLNAPERSLHGSDSGLSITVRKKWSQYGRQRYSLSWTSEFPFKARLCGERGRSSPRILCSARG